MHSGAQCTRPDKPLELADCRLAVALSPATKKGLAPAGRMEEDLLGICGSTGLFPKAHARVEFDFISQSE